MIRKIKGKIKEKSYETIEDIAMKATKWIGSTGSLIFHTIIFAGAFSMYIFGISLDEILLILTTIVSLEAIYLSIFIQMSVNKHDIKLHSVAEDVEDIQEDIGDIQEDVDEIQKDVDDIQEDVEDIQEEDEEEDIIEKEEDKRIEKIEDMLGRLIEEIIDLKKDQKQIREIKKDKTKLNKKKSD